MAVVLIMTAILVLGIKLSSEAVHPGS
jgi:hypothetical protein